MLALDPRKERLTILPQEFLDQLPPGKNRVYGAAFDIGTTTIVGMLWDLAENRLIKIVSATNPQAKYGQDVISRINYCMEEKDGLLTLHRMIVASINELMDQLTENVPPRPLTKITAVGNTTMCHLLLNRDPASLARAPYEPGYKGSAEILARTIGIRGDENAMLLVLPGIAGHVGSDITAGMVACGLVRMPGTVLYIDVGTNGEIVLVSEGQLAACSAAAGPAFEGASIRCGTRATRGAVERVVLTEKSIDCETISGDEPCGICGSGLIDAVAQLLKWRVVDHKGKMKKPGEAPELSPFLQSRLSLTENGPAFQLTDTIHIYQQDIREVQLAKGAILAGCEILLKNAGKTATDLDQILIAGAFGNYIDRGSALRIGLFPGVEETRVVHAGNAAGAGASMALLSKDAFSKAEEAAEKTRHVSLSSHPGFEMCYAHAMYFPK
jgi:uncharacterized 2Fe-2S/4Fe-4S cluster protein (DUF4445 family)